MEDAIDRLSHYFSILTVRHPLTRLESGFRDQVLDYYKITNNINEYFEIFLSRIINRDEKTGLNVHYRPVTWHTNPCAIPFR